MRLINRSLSLLRRQCRRQLYSSPSCILVNNHHRMLQTHGEFEMNDDDEHFLEHLTEINMTAEGDSAEFAVQNQTAIDERIRTYLLNKGITQLFPVQARTFNESLNRKDLLVRSHTGSGKTLAFAIPICQRFLLNATKPRRMKPYALVLEPTRELAEQVCVEFASLPGNIKVVPVYGGASYMPQITGISNGAHVVVACPGRLIDLIERGNIDLSGIETLVLDEADEMLKMGFQKNIEQILANVKQSGAHTHQTLLFSATMPRWVKQISNQYTKKATYVEFIGDNETQIPDQIKHLAISVPADIESRASLIADLVDEYAPNERVMVFCQTKLECDMYARSSQLRKLCNGTPLHGDITQRVRQQTINAFKRKNATMLVCTDVAARGVDIPDVKLVIQVKLPEKQEAYVHRAGRTGRANKEGTCIILHEYENRDKLAYLAKGIGQDILCVSAPSMEHSQSSMEQIVKKLLHNNVVVSPEVRTLQTTLEALYGDDLTGRLLQAAIVQKIPRQRSPLTSTPGLVTLVARRNPGHTLKSKLSVRILRSIIERAFPKESISFGASLEFNDAAGGGIILEIPESLKAPLLAFMETASGKSVSQLCQLSIVNTLEPEWLQLSNLNQSYATYNSLGVNSRGGGRGNNNQQQERFQRQQRMGQQHQRMMNNRGSSSSSSSSYPGGRRFNDQRRSPPPDKFGQAPGGGHRNNAWYNNERGQDNRARNRNRGRDFLSIDDF